MAFGISSHWLTTDSVLYPQISPQSSVGTRSPVALLRMLWSEKGRSHSLGPPIPHVLVLNIILQPSQKRCDRLTARGAAGLDCDTDAKKALAVRSSAAHSLTNASHLWHDDIHVEKVFVNPDDPSEIYAFIDWQSTELAPLYDHVIEPYILDYNGPSLYDLLEQRKLADIQALFHDEPGPVAKRKADSLFTKMSLVALYRFLLYKKMPRLFKALEFCQTDSFQLLLLARNLLIDGEATYLGLRAEQQENKWTGVPGISQGTQNAPLYFSREEIQQIKKDAEAAARSMELMGDVRRMIGSRYFQAQGLVSHQQFRELEQILPKVKEQFLQMHAKSKEEEVEIKRAWPFNVLD